MVIDNTTSSSPHANNPSGLFGTATITQIDGAEEKMSSHDRRLPNSPLRFQASETTPGMGLLGSLEVLSLYLLERSFDEVRRGSSRGRTRAGDPDDRGDRDVLEWASVQYES